MVTTPAVLAWSMSMSARTCAQVLSDIQTGVFAKNWINENLAGRPSFLAMRNKEAEGQLEEVGKGLRAMMPLAENTDINRPYQIGVISSVALSSIL